MSTLDDTSTGTFFDAEAIRDTNAHTSATSTKKGFQGPVLFALRSTLNQTTSVQFQGSIDGTNWHNLGSATSLTDGSGTEQKAVETVSDPWPFLRAVATSGSSPASGSLTVKWAARGA